MPADRSDHNSGYRHMAVRVLVRPALPVILSLRTLRRILAAMIAVVRTVLWIALLVRLILVRLAIPLAVIRIAHHDSFHQVTFKLHLPH